MDKIVEIIKANQTLAIIIGCLFVALVVLIIIAIVTRGEKTASEEVETIIEEKVVEAPIAEPSVEAKSEPVVIREEEKVITREEPSALKSDPKVAEKKLEEKPEQPMKEAETKEEDKSAKIGRVLVGKIEVFPVKPYFMFALKASNGEVILTSDVYKTKNAAMTGAQNLQKVMGENPETIVTEDKRGQWQFRFLSAARRVVAIGANYETEKGATSAAESVLRFAPTANIVYLEEPNTLPDIQKADIGTVEAKKGGKINIYQDEDLGYYFQLLANNGAIMCTSELYKTQTTCKNGIETLKNNVKTGEFIVVKDKRGFYQFKLYNSTLSRLIAVGESYLDRAQAISSAKSVASFIDNAELQ